MRLGPVRGGTYSELIRNLFSRAYFAAQCAKTFHRVHATYHIRPRTKSTHLPDMIVDLKNKRCWFTGKQGVSSLVV